MAKPSLITNRRQLLIGAGALALTGAALPAYAFGSRALSRGGGAPGFDPASLAFFRAAKAEGELRKCPLTNWEDEQEYYTLYRAFIDAELTLANTPATSLTGISAKIKRLGADMLWKHGDMCMASRLGFSALTDLHRMIAATSPGWPADALNPGRRS